MRNKRKNIGMILSIALLLLATVCLMGGTASAKTVYYVGEDAEKSVENIEKYTNDSTGYRSWIDDRANLLTENEEKELLTQMQSMTEYGDTVFLTSRDFNASEVDLATEYLEGNMNRQSATLFLIDMFNRKIYIYSDGVLYRKITKSYANTITDNVYRYATRGEYYECASQVFEQELALLQGEHIAQPMKYASNILLAIVFALFINYFIVRITSSTKKSSDNELMGALYFQQEVMDGQKKFLHSHRVRRSSSSGGGHSGGGGGGGHSGGGGGHSF